MPMIDVYAPAGAFEDKHELARSLAAAVMAVEEVPDITMFRQNTNFPPTRSPTWRAVRIARACKC
ncbi:MAG TPA: hypothetical protein VGI68_15080 [Mycobacterium sp.]|jgi:hypothetical protein